jgi:hypothetical protein
LFSSMFPMCSHCVLFMFHGVPQVPKLFPKTFPIARQFYPIWFAQSSTFMYLNWKGGLLESTFVSILQLRVKRGASIGECPMFPKYWWWANECGFLVFKKKVQHTHEYESH